MRKTKQSEIDYLKEQLRLKDMQIKSQRETIQKLGYLENKFIRILYHKFANDWTKEEKQRHFLLIKKQIKTAKTFEDVPALSVMFDFWNLSRVFKNFIEHLTNKKIDLIYYK